MTPIRIAVLVVQSSSSDASQQVVSNVHIAIHDGVQRLCPRGDEDTWLLLVLVATTESLRRPYPVHSPTVSSIVQAQGFCSCQHSFAVELCALTFT